jgi:hypothetical protein
MGSLVLRVLTDMNSSYSAVIRERESMSAQIKALLLLIGAESLTAFPPEIKTWIKEILETVYPDFGSLTDADGFELTRLAVAEPSGSLLEDQYVIYIECGDNDLTRAGLRQEFSKFWPHRNQRKRRL